MWLLEKRHRIFVGTFFESTSVWTYSAEYMQLAAILKSLSASGTSSKLPNLAVPTLACRPLLDAKTVCKQVKVILKSLRLSLQEKYQVWTKIQIFLKFHRQIGLVTRGYEDAYKNAKADEAERRQDSAM